MANIGPAAYRYVSITKSVCRQISIHIGSLPINTDIANPKTFGRNGGEFFYITEQNCKMLKCQTFQLHLITFE